MRELQNESIANRASSVLATSALSRSSLDEKLKSLLAQLTVAAETKVGEICFSINETDERQAHRGIFVFSSKDDLIAKLNKFIAGESEKGIYSSPEQGSPARADLAFLFTGQGCQYAGMAKQLYLNSLTFKSTMRRCLAILDDTLKSSMEDVLLGAQTEILNQTQYAQPALFAIEYSLFELWKSWGILPSAVIGHSVGEYVAACVAGVFDLNDGLRFIAKRGQLMGSLPSGGGMTSVSATETMVNQVISEFGGKLSIAALNAPESVVISGASEYLELAASQFEENDIQCQPLVVSHAFHSNLMDPILDQFEAYAKGVNYGKPYIAVVSNLTGEVISDSTMSHAEYWRRHLRGTVNFSQGMKALHGMSINTFLEVGPTPKLINIGRTNLPEDAEVDFLYSLREKRSDCPTITDNLCQLGAKGYSVNWNAVNQDLQTGVSIL